MRMRCSSTYTKTAQDLSLVPLALNSFRSAASAGIGLIKDRYVLSRLRRPYSVFSSDVSSAIALPSPSCHAIGLTLNKACVVLHNSPSNRFRGYRDAWLPLVIPDPAAFQQFLATFALHLQKLDPSMVHELDVPTLALHSTSLASINARILSPDFATDDGVLVTIISFVAHYVSILQKPALARAEPSSR